MIADNSSSNKHVDKRLTHDLLCYVYNVIPFYFLKFMFSDMKFPVYYIYILWHMASSSKDAR